MTVAGLPPALISNPPCGRKPQTFPHPLSAIHHHLLAAGLCLSAISGAARADGVAVLKEQTYHRDCSAKPVAYQRIISSSGPYLRFVTSTGNLDIPRSKLADRIEIPTSVPRNISSETEAAPLRDTLASLRTFSTRYPLSAGLLAPAIASLTAHLARFDSGEVRFEGAWLTKDELKSLLDQRQREADARRKREVEQVIRNESRTENGWVWKNGVLVSPEEARLRETTARTDLSDTLWPLLKPDMDAARMTLENLATLASNQNGAPKIRTERLHNAIRNLFSAEFALSRQLAANSAAAEQAAAHDRHADDYLKPNSFGRIRTEAARDSRAKALRIRSDAAKHTADLRDSLSLQLREADTVALDFHKLGELRVALCLSETTRTIATRSLPDGDFKPSIPDKTLADLRRRIYPGK